jgi:hypothetical protein
LQCESKVSQVAVGLPIDVVAEIPDTEYQYEYTWKFVSLPEGTSIDRESLMFHSDRQSITFTPDVAGQYSLQVIVWQYNDKISLQSFNYDAVDDIDTEKSLIIDDSWLDLRIEVPQDTSTVTLVTVDLNTDSVEKEAPLTTIEFDDRPEQPTVVIDTVLSDGAISDTMFTIQIASKKTIKEAWRIVEELIADGYDAYIQKAYIYPEDQMWFRVRIGKYETKAEAENAAATISKNRNQSTWIDFFREEE